MIQEAFIKKANIVHNYKYDYSKIKYIHINTKIIIICPLHGKFIQSPNNHIHIRIKYNENIKNKLKEFYDTN